jgi:hypothetical protein
MKCTLICIDNQLPTTESQLMRDECLNERVVARVAELGCDAGTQRVMGAQPTEMRPPEKL